MKTTSKVSINTEFTSSYPDEVFHIEENVKTWDVYSNVFGDDKPATTYDKRDWTYEEAVSDYRENGVF